MVTHKHRWTRDPYDWGYCCRCGAWTFDKKIICLEGTEPMTEYNSLKGRWRRAKATFNDKDYEKIWKEKLTFRKRIKRTIASFMDTQRWDYNEFKTKHKD